MDANLRQYAPEVIAGLNASQAVFESIGPMVLTDVAAVAAKGAELARAADLAGITRVGSSGEVLLDVSVVSALVAAGLTDRRWVADGGKLMVKLVESGVGAVLLEKAELLRVLAERRLITRLLDLELMDALLDRPEMTKEMFRSGVVKGVLCQRRPRALLAAGKEDVVCGFVAVGDAGDSDGHGPAAANDDVREGSGGECRAADRVRGPQRGRGLTATRRERGVNFRDKIVSTATLVLCLLRVLYATAKGFERF